MSHDLDLLRRTVAAVARIAGGAATDADHARDELWAALAEIGVAELDGAGGDGGTLREVLAVTEELGAAVVSVPYLATCVAGRWAAERAGLDVPDGMLALATPPDGVRAVRWAGTAAAVVVVGAQHDAAWRSVSVVADAGHDGSPDVDGVPRGAVDCAGSAVAVGRLSVEDAEMLEVRVALGTAAVLAGAGRAALEATVRHATTRTQFGRHLLDFQAVRHDVVVAHAEAHLAAMALQRAIEVAEVGEGPALRRAAAAALVCGSEAARRVARTSHQVHGAIGLTEEHDLWRWTMRLAAHRRVHVDADAWAADLGAALLGADDAWALLSGDDAPR